MDSKSSVNTRQDKQKENHIQSDPNQTAKNPMLKSKTLKAAKEDKTTLCTKEQ